VNGELCESPSLAPSSPSVGVPPDAITEPFDEKIADCIDDETLKEIDEEHST
jgi:hypothetical protein